jgi:hypothetical protein
VLLTILGGAGATIPVSPDPPTVTSASVDVAGTALAAALSESGCGPASGTGGFYLSGTSATIVGWTIVPPGTTVDATLAGTVYQGEVLTLGYRGDRTLDDVVDSTGDALADFDDLAVTNNSAEVYTPPAASTTRRLTPGARNRYRSR